MLAIIELKCATIIVKYIACSCFGNKNINFFLQILAENELEDTVFCVTFDGGNW